MLCLNYSISCSLQSRILPSLLNSNDFFWVEFGILSFLLITQIGRRRRSWETHLFLRKPLSDKAFVGKSNDMLVHIELNRYHLLFSPDSNPSSWGCLMWPVGLLTVIHGDPSAFTLYVHSLEPDSSNKVGCFILLHQTRLEGRSNFNIYFTFYYFSFVVGAFLFL